MPFTPGRRFGPDKPVLVLTSGTTFSGGEGLAYDLQQLGRATVVGERTRGGAHPVERFRIRGHLQATIPVARSLSPLSGGVSTNSAPYIPNVTSHTDEIAAEKDLFWKKLRLSMGWSLARSQRAKPPSTVRAPRPLAMTSPEDQPRTGASMMDPPRAAGPRTP